MAFTASQIASVSNQNKAPAPSFDPNGSTMQKLSVPSNNTGSNGIANDIGADIKNIPSDYMNVFKDIASAADEAGTNVRKDALDFYSKKDGSPQTNNSYLDNAIGAGIHVAGDTLGGVAKTAAAPFKPVVKDIANITSDIGTQSQANAQDSLDSAKSSAIQSSIGQKVQQYIQQNPESARYIKDFANMVTGGLALQASPTDIVDAGINAGTAGVNTVKSGISNISDNISNIADSSAAETTKPIDTASSRIKDATPEYNEEMIGTNVKTPEGKVVPRIASESEGLNGKRPITVSASEHAAGTELNNIKDYPDNGTNLDKQLATQKAISTEAESMRSGLQAEDKATPLNADAEKIKVSQLVRGQLPEDIQAKIGVNTPEENAMLRGMSEKAGSPVPEGGKFDLRSPGEEVKFPKTAAGKYYSKVMDALNEYNGTREGKLDLRQVIDGAYKDARGKLAFGSDSQNAIDEVNTGIRDSLNKDLAETTKNTDTQSSLKKQTNLFRANDTLIKKAQAESETAFGRIEQKYPLLKNLVRIARRQGIMIPIRVVETAVGIGLIGAYLRKAIAGK